MLLFMPIVLLLVALAGEVAGIGPYQRPCMKSARKRPDWPGGGRALHLDEAFRTCMQARPRMAAVALCRGLSIIARHHHHPREAYIVENLASSVK